MGPAEIKLIPVSSFGSVGIAAYCLVFVVFRLWYANSDFGDVLVSL